MNNHRNAAPVHDAAIEAQGRLRGRGKRRLARSMLKRSAEWRRLMLRAMVFGVAAVVATKFVLARFVAVA